jgi:hypothetical protein
MLVFNHAQRQRQQQQQQQQHAGNTIEPHIPAGASVQPTRHAAGTHLFLSLAAAEAGAAAGVCLDRTHLQELNSQPRSQHQQQLIQHPQYAAQQAAVLSNAAELLQASWRARCIRLQYKQQLQQHLQQQVLAAASVTLQSMWRGCQARQLAVLMRQQRQQQLVECAAAKHAAAVRIQAAVRGFGIRRRLKAALAAATAAQASAELGAEASSWDDEFEGVADDFVSMSPALLQELMQPEVQGGGGSWALHAAGGSSSQSAGGDAGYKVLAAATSSSYSVMQAAAGAAQPPLPLPPSVQPASALSIGRSGCSGEECVGDDDLPAPDSAAGHPAAASAAAVRYEAKLQQLMQEWGFTDRATAEAYYRCAE